MTEVLKVDDVPATDLELLRLSCEVCHLVSGVAQR